MKVKSLFIKAKDLAVKLTTFDESKHLKRQVGLVTSLLITLLLIIASIAILSYSLYPLIFVPVAFGALAVTNVGCVIFNSVFVAPILIVGSLAIDIISIPCQLLINGIKKLFKKGNKIDDISNKKQKNKLNSSKNLKSNCQENKKKDYSEEGVQYCLLDCEEKKITRVSNKEKQKTKNLKNQTNFDVENSL